MNNLSRFNTVRGHLQIIHLALDFAQTTTLLLMFLMSWSNIETNSRGEKESPRMMPFSKRTSPVFVALYDGQIFHAIISMVSI